MGAGDARESSGRARGVQAGCARCVQTPPERSPPLRWTRVAWSLFGPGLGVRWVSPRKWHEPRALSPVPVPLDQKWRETLPSRTGHLKRGRGWGGRAEHMGTLKQTRHGTTARGILRFHGDTSLRGAARGRAQPLQSRPRRSQRPSRGAPAPGSGPTRARLEASPQMLCRDGGRAAPTCREGAGRPRRSPRPASPLGHSVLVGSRVS